MPASKQKDRLNYYTEIGRNVKENFIIIKTSVPPVWLWRKKPQPIL